MTVASVRSDIDGMTEAAFRTEVLCQWVTADIIPFINPKLWAHGTDNASCIPPRIAWCWPWTRRPTVRPRMWPLPVCVPMACRTWN